MKYPRVNSSLMSEGRMAFTLIEVLVVIAIIAILAALLFPVFASARERARSAACESNLRQISLAYAQYVEDNDSTFPSAWAGDPMHPGWAIVLQPYIRNTRVLDCPSDRYNYTAGNPSWFYTTYWTNGNLSRQQSGIGSPLAGIAEGALTAPSLTILAGDGVGAQGIPAYNQCGNGNMATPTWPCPAWNSVTSDAIFAGTADQHLGGSNYVFTDSHVEHIHGDQPGRTSTITGGYGRADQSGGKPTFGI